MCYGYVRSCREAWVTSFACVAAAFVHLRLFKCLDISPVVALVSVTKDDPQGVASRCLKSGVPGFTGEDMAREAQAFPHSVQSGTWSPSPALCFLDASAARGAGRLPGAVRCVWEGVQGEGPAFPSSPEEVE